MNFETAMTQPFASLADGARMVLECPQADEKARLGHRLAKSWRSGELPLFSPGDGPMPDRPNRPAKPELLTHRAMPKRTFKGERGRFALLHSLAHIELNAIDLAFDMAGRWARENLPRAFFDDWIKVGDEEAKHFLAVQGRLAAMGGTYGDLPAHNGLWEAAEETRHDLLARLAVVPLVLEARGLDVTPVMIERLTGAGDLESADVLRMIYSEEQQHVGAGARWFTYLCDEGEISPAETFHALVRKHFRGLLKPPFNDEARAAAGLHPTFYEPLTSR
ncbi:MAG: ferritin-like domain-containing protein [Parvibaculum sp.]|uniref:ferritin-like domain-containing protein n=1 Tax=Parvibaculum sp. TaxID=2024848 RepID=UPI003C731322